MERWAWNQHHEVRFKARCWEDTSPTGHIFSGMVFYIDILQYSAECGVRSHNIHKQHKGFLVVKIREYFRVAKSVANWPTGEPHLRAGWGVGSSTIMS